jgi:hypothetical protein
VKSKTIILDIDGCIFKHGGNGACDQWTTRHALLDAVKVVFDKLEREGCFIMLVTARKESCRCFLEDELRACGLFWDALVMGLPSGQRILVNDEKPDASEPSAIALVVKRNEGLSTLLKGVV